MKAFDQLLLVAALFFGAMWVSNGGTLIPSDRLIDLPGTNVLVVYEKSAMSRMPKEQAAIITDTGWRGLCDDWMVLDKDVEFIEPNTPWEKALNRERGSLPWVVVSSDQGGEELALPSSPEAMAELVGKWGGK